MSLLKKASIITTPTAYAEDYLYSIKPAYALGSELIPSIATISNANGGTITQISGNIYSSTSDGTSGSSIRPKIDFATTSGKTYKLIITPIGTITGTVNFDFYDGSSYIFQNYDFTTVKEIDFTDNGSVFAAFDGTQTYSVTNFSISIKEITDADFDFDRNSTGTRVNEDYLIEDVPYNLAKYSESFNNWTKFGTPTIEDNNIIAPNGTLTGAKVTRGSNATPLRLNNVTFLNQEYTFSVYAKKGNHNQINLDIGDVSNATYTLTDDWQRFTVTSTPTANTHIDITLPSSTSGDFIYVWGAQVVKGDQPKDYLKTTDRLDIPRIDYTNGEPSILLEPSRTNLITYSNDFTNAAWNKTDVTITANQTISPEGIQNADKYSGTTTSQNFFHTISVSDNFSYSIYVKYINAPFIRIRVDSISTWFNIETIEVATNNFNDASIEDVGNGWRKLTVINTTSGSFTTAYIHPHATDNTTGEQDGGEFFLYGAQLEAGSYATSLIHTSGSAVTRSADVANNAGNSDLINSTEGVLYAEIKALADDGTFRLITISAGANNNIVKFGYRSTSQAIYYEVRSGNVSQAFQIYTTQNVLEYHKVAIKYKENDFALYINGSEVMTDNSGIVPVGMNSLQFEDFVGNCKMIAVFKEALSDEELEKLTGYNNHELYMNYYNRLSYLGLAEEYNVESDINNYIL